MSEASYEFERFSDREGFNRSLDHFKTVSSLLDDVESYYNLADILNAMLSAKEITQNQLSPTLYALLVDKYGYEVRSINMPTVLEEFAYIRERVSEWRAVDIVIAYHHPDLGFTVMNPKNAEHWEMVQSLRKNELVTVYVGGFQNEVDPKVSKKALDTLERYLEGKKSRSADMLTDGAYDFKGFSLEEEEEEPQQEKKTSARKSSRKKARGAPRSTRQEYKPSAGADDEDSEESEADSVPEDGEAAAAVAPTGNKRMTPTYSVPVTNELFHNGNVEAWKKVIESYETKYPGCEVVVFYDGERIHDINTLFKWGKVKHGSTILFAVVGESIKDVAKLQRYLRQGASPQFEAFLRVPVNTVLKLF